MHLQVFDGTALDLSDVRFGQELTLRPAGRREWAQFYGSRACPLCLRASGGVWPSWWRLGWAAACPRHGTVLVDRCAGCGLVLRRGARRHPQGLSTTRSPGPRVCGAGVGGKRHCEEDLTALPVAPAGARLVAAQ